MARSPRPSARDVLARHQFSEGDVGGCVADDGWGLYAQPEVDENVQMADHQIEMLAEAGYEPTETRVNHAERHRWVTGGYVAGFAVGSRQAPLPGLGDVVTAAIVDAQHAPHVGLMRATMDGDQRIEFTNVALLDEEETWRLLNSLLGTDAIHTMFARALIADGYAVVKVGTRR